ncbi:ATP-binding cassette domain-containing protein [Vibrio sp. PP-XX7]
MSQLSDFTASYRKIEGLALASEAHFEQKMVSNRQFAEQLSWQTLSVNQATFRYGAENADDYTFHIGPVDATFQRGEVVFLTGGNGSGKSTFGKLLVGLYQLDTGTIALDEQVVTESISLEDYQQLYSTIFSDFHLFEHVLNDTGELAQDNVIAGHLKALELDHRVTSTDGKLSSVSMSQGQKKRLAMLMSYIEDTPICLYDEWAADQDPRFREIFYTEIIPALKRRE